MGPVCTTPTTTLKERHRNVYDLIVSAELTTVLDPNGREVVLDEAGWQHILDNHPEMRAHRSALLDTVRRPDVRRPDLRPGRTRFYRREAGPSRWCFVVVDYNQQPARIVTALGMWRDPA